MVKQYAKELSRADDDTLNVPASTSSRPATRDQTVDLSSKGAKLAKKKPHHNYQFVDIQKRIHVIYDNFVHDMQPKDIAMAGDIKYNTVRSILKNFYQNGRVNVKKKKSGYLKG